MRYSLILLLFVLLSKRTVCRPQPVENLEDSEGDEAEYESDSAEADDALEEEQEQRAGHDESAVDDEAADDSGQLSGAINRNSHQPRSAEAFSSADNNNLSGYKTIKSNEEEPDDQLISNNECRSSSERRDSGKYVDKDLVDQSKTRHFSNLDDSSKTLRDDKSPVYRQSSQHGSNEESDALFEGNENTPGRRGRADKNDYERPLDSNSQFRYSKSACMSLHHGASEENKYTKINSDRDRRAAHEMNDSELIGSTAKVKEPISSANGAPAAENVPSNDAGAAISADSGAKDAAAITNVAEDEEAAIKRHVKKLSANELQELLNSLSEDKRQLLKKIIDSDGESNNDVNKREITKKAGAAPDDNSYLESGQSESNKLQEGSVGPELNLQSTSTDSAESNNNQNSAQSSTISSLPVTSKPSDSSKSNENTIDPKVQSNLVQSPLTDSNNQAAQTQPKTENKREAVADLPSVEDEEDKLFDSGVSNEFGYSCPQHKEMLEIDDDKSEFNSKDGNSLKREAPSEKDMSDSIKSLEESFPNSNSYEDDDPYSNSDLAPLVRVKRKNLNLIIKKRGANIMPDAKVGFVPYRAENDDEDNDEGNEFDDDGFYDRTSNLAKNDVKDTLSEEGTPTHLEDLSLRQKSENKNCKADSELVDNPSELNNNMESETAHLGSDTDSVLSGVEGMDENLMFNSASRNRRTVANEEKPGLENADTAAKEQSRLARSTALDEEIKSVSDNYANVPNYQEKDAFGPLPRSYEGDLSRYKRIRRVKQPAGFS